jgi:hypothetical protein
MPSHGRGHWFETSIAHREKELIRGTFGCPCGAFGRPPWPKSEQKVTRNSGGRESDLEVSGLPRRVDARVSAIRSQRRTRSSVDSMATQTGVLH